MIGRSPRSRTFIKSPLDFYGGLVLVAIALIALWAAGDLRGARGISFGPGTAPRLFAGLLAFAGAAVAVLGLLASGSGSGRYPIRGPLLVTASVLVFAGTIRPFGLVASTFVTILVAASASPETRWREAVAFAAGLTVFCTLVFHYLVGLTAPLWPWG